METGLVVEFIDHEKVMCAVVQEVKHQRLRLLTETNREVSISTNRLCHKSNRSLDPVLGRNRLVEMLRYVSEKRRELSHQIEVREIWEVLHTEQEWIDVSTMAHLCFSSDITCDHESAVIRAFFQNRIYFKFDHDRFFPIAADQVQRLIEAQQEAERRKRLIETGSSWLKHALAAPNAALSMDDDIGTVIPVLRSYYLFDSDAPQAALAKEILSRADIRDPEKLFDIFVRLGVFHPDENLDVLRYGIPIRFQPELEEHARHLMSRCSEPDWSGRRDLTGLSIMTVDGQSTLDYDDAISVETIDDGYRVGVHIVDVGHILQRGDPLDIEAKQRASSIYLPDLKIPMLPSCLSEGVCSLKADHERPAISILMDLDRMAQLRAYRIEPSVIRVRRQMSYFDVNQMADSDSEIMVLYDLARQFRERRIESGAVHISLPDISVWIAENGEININRINRESPGRMMVSELMILANWVMARFLAEHSVSAIFRSQPGPRERLYPGTVSSVFLNYIQRKMLSRFIIRSDPEPHTGLGVDAYVTATSPIRKYTDLVTQRQIRSVLGLEPAYSREEIDSLIQQIQQPLTHVSRIQQQRNRYWILKYLETQIGKKEEAVVLQRKRDGVQVLLPDFMMECEMPLSAGVELKPGASIQVTVQHVNARRNVLAVFL
ncbi:ribonuclease catalytic domain-containing protein [Desulfatirhabdium butyrativorans]|uniref:ribonuclease catalytic domain-containing protein n=1 Tax=Desulfatirhabdium butyrativorans TaxID=340467 RepID=UPI0005542C85|nr:RNB domain-containing ribonuclease [Desulfatirhabdium butyrativorans]